MNCIDLNCLGSFLYKENISDLDKRKLSFSKIKYLSDELLDKLICKIADIQEHRIKNDISYIDCLKSILLLCYLNNVNLNKYLHIEIKDE